MPMLPSPPLKFSAWSNVLLARLWNALAPLKTLPTVWLGEYPVGPHTLVWFFQNPGVHPSSPRSWRMQTTMLSRAPEPSASPTVAVPMTNLIELLMVGVLDGVTTWTLPS